MIEGTCSMHVTGSDCHIILGTNLGFSEGVRNRPVRDDHVKRRKETRKSAKNFAVEFCELFMCKTDTIEDEYTCSDRESKP